ncbi:oligosaccharide flippase family protein [Methylobacillus methanolivorans]|uniref:Oligosaccharide flippase family protein n=1 Tax=Methylobacillus methanolivorans TaxID=1848927 RepID=A0ABW8GH56_9PROT
MVSHNKIKSAISWSVVEAISSIGLSLISIVFLARVLLPEDYGLVATAQFISGSLQLVLSFGLIEAVIQKKDLNNEYIASALFGSLILAGVGGIIAIGISYGFYLYNPSSDIAIIMLFEAISTVLMLAAVVPSALLMRNMEMKAFTKRTLISRVFFFVVAIPLAYTGYGVWSIVFANLVQISIATFLIFWGARPLMSRRFYFDFSQFIELGKFGFYVMFENLLWNVMSRVFGVLIALFHGTSAVGLYNMATKITDAILNILNTIVTRSALPIFSLVQSDHSKLFHAFQKATFLFNLISMPMFFMLAMTCPTWVPIVLGDNWSPVVPIIQIIAVMYGIMYSRMFVGVAIKAVGRSKDYLIVAFIAALITLAASFATIDQTLIITLFALAIPRILITIPLGVYLMKKILGFDLTHQFLPLKFPIITSVLVLTVSFIAKILTEIYTDSSIVILSTQLFGAGLVFLLMCFILAKKGKFSSSWI